MKRPSGLDRVLLPAACVLGAALAAQAAPAAADKTAAPAGGKPVAAKPSSDAPVARVNGQPITRRDFDLMVQVLFRQLGPGQRGHEDLKATRQAALDTLIDHELLSQKAKGSGITVGDQEVRDETERLRKALGGPEVTRQFLDQNGLQDSDLEAQVRRTLLVSHFVDKEVVPGIAIDDAAARAWYDAHPEVMQRPEAVHIRQIVVQVPQGASSGTRAQAREKVEDLLKALRSGEDFATLARQHSDGPEAAKGGDSGYVWAGGGALPPVELAALALRPGETSDVIETRRGFHIVQAIERRPAGTIPFEEARSGIVARLRREEKDARVKAYVAKERAAAKIEKLI
jgi:peptidyl-prolyl cis-trans isomerase C